MSPHCQTVKALKHCHIVTTLSSYQTVTKLSLCQTLTTLSQCKTVTTLSTPGLQWLPAGKSTGRRQVTELLHAANITLKTAVTDLQSKQDQMQAPSVIPYSLSVTAAGLLFASIRFLDTIDSPGPQL